MTKLEAVNKIMRRAGHHPVKVLETDQASNAAEAERCLDESNLEVQGDGYNFNTRSNVTLSPDGAGNISVPSGVIAIWSVEASGGVFNRGLNYGYPSGTGTDITTQGDKLYDLANNTLVFTSDVTVNYTQLWEFHCVPFPVQDFITMLAACRFNEKRGNKSLQNSIERDAMGAKTRARQFNSDQENNNVLNTTHAAKFRGQRISLPSSPT